MPARLLPDSVAEYAEKVATSIGWRIWPPVLYVDVAVSHQTSFDGIYNYVHRVTWSLPVVSLCGRCTTPTSRPSWTSASKILTPHWSVPPHGAAPPLSFRTILRSSSRQWLKKRNPKQTPITLPPGAALSTHHHWLGSMWGFALRECLSQNGPLILLFRRV